MLTAIHQRKQRAPVAGWVMAGLVVRGDVRLFDRLADTPAEVLRLDFGAFERIRRRFPFTGAKLFRNLARVLALRLRNVTELWVESQPLAGAAPRTEGA
jgi:hypothetical protein